VSDRDRSTGTQQKNDEEGSTQDGAEQHDTSFDSFHSSLADVMRAIDRSYAKESAGDHAHISNPRATPRNLNPRTVGYVRLRTKARREALAALDLSLIPPQ
jgi:hypothetical protein